jgi:uncharacterized phage protein gp47/JayE
VAELNTKNADLAARESASEVSSEGLGSAEVQSEGVVTVPREVKQAFIEQPPVENAWHPKVPQPAVSEDSDIKQMLAGLMEVMQQSQSTIKADLAKAKAEIQSSVKADLSNTKGEIHSGIKADLSSVRADLDRVKSEIQNSVKAELAANQESLKLEIMSIHKEIQKEKQQLHKEFT